MKLSNLIEIECIAISDNAQSVWFNPSQIEAQYDCLSLEQLDIDQTYFDFEETCEFLSNDFQSLEIAKYCVESDTYYN